MKTKKLIASICIIAALACIPTAAVSAEEPTSSASTPVSNSTSSFPTIDGESFADLTNNENTSSTSSLYAQYQELISGIDATKLFENNAALNEEAVQRLNLQYSGLAQSMTDLGYGSYATIDLPQISSGYSTNIMQEFQNTFGDVLSNHQLTTAELPDVSSMLADMSAARDEQLGDYRSNEVFQTVNNQISMSKVFDLTQDDFVTYDLMPSLELANTLNDIASIAGQANQEDSAEYQTSYDRYANNVAAGYDKEVNISERDYNNQESDYRADNNKEVYGMNRDAEEWYNLRKDLTQNPTFASIIEQYEENN